MQVIRKEPENENTPFVLINSFSSWVLFWSFVCFLVLLFQNTDIRSVELVCHSQVQGEPASPISESLAMAELSSHSSGEAISDSVIQEGDWLDGEAETIKKKKGLTGCQLLGQVNGQFFDSVQDSYCGSLPLVTPSTVWFWTGKGKRTYRVPEG